MKISYSWLKEYVKTDLSAEEAGLLLTDCGLEIESVEKFETVKGGLEGIVVGHVMSKEKHPDADRLNLTTVDVGTGTLLNIVCGASNVAAGQKVLVAMVGAKLYPAGGEMIEIKKSKIRGALSEGMICAEDEIGMGTSHDGIMVLPSDTPTGMPAKEFFKIESDEVLEIGLTPNRADAASHIGVARDLVAVLNIREDENNHSLHRPHAPNFIQASEKVIDVVVEDKIACPRYSGICISNIKVAESPEWMKSRLKAIGLRPINNIVDITNYVLHETGQPLHAFDLTKIKGNKIIVKTLREGTSFTTLDGTERKLSGEDLMICNADAGMCIAGVFGGLESGVTESTTSIFLESAYFNSSSVRKTSRRHGLKTDASFRFERGTDPNLTVFALQRAAFLINEIAGGEVSSSLKDIYPEKIENKKVPFSFENCDRLIGKHVDIAVIKRILSSLEIEIEHEGHDALLLSVPAFKVDVTREQDVIEEVLRIYGYNNIEIPTALNSSLSYAEKPDKEKAQELVADLLSNNGFSEIMCLSLTKEEYSLQSPFINEAQNVKMLNPLSSDLNVMRQTLLFSGLETIAYNLNRKTADLRLYEFGKTYLKTTGDQSKYIETKHLSVFITGRKMAESWNSAKDNVNFYSLKGYVQAIFERLGIEVKLNEKVSDLFSRGLSLTWNKKVIAEFGAVSKSLLKIADVRQEVFYADINWDVVLEALKKKTISMYVEVPKFPEVRRDLALLIDKSVKFEQLEQLAFQAEKNLLKAVGLFDVYEGDKLPEGKKSYAMSFTLVDENATLTDKQIEKIMEKLMKTYQEKAGAEIRS
jgi:phenylalanyl-tRNA synthetase beta chain